MVWPLDSKKSKKAFLISFEVIFLLFFIFKISYMPQLRQNISQKYNNFYKKTYICIHAEIYFQ